MITVADIMTLNPITVEPDTPLAEAVGLMKSHKCRHLLITENDRLAGIITDRDIRLAMNSPMVMRDRSDDLALLKNVTVGVTMTADPMTVAPGDPAIQAAKTMLAHKFGALPVVDGTALVGIVTDSDILKSYIDLVKWLSRVIAPENRFEPPKRQGRQEIDENMSQQ